MYMRGFNFHDLLEIYVVEIQHYLIFTFVEVVSINCELEIIHDGILNLFRHSLILWPCYHTWWNAAYQPKVLNLLSFVFMVWTVNCGDNDCRKTGDWISCRNLQQTRLLCSQKWCHNWRSMTCSLPSLNTTCWAYWQIGLPQCLTAACQASRSGTASWNCCGRWSMISMLFSGFTNVNATVVVLEECCVIV